MKLSKLFIASFLLLPLCSLKQAQAAEKPWKNVSELSVVSANGNSKSTSASAKNTFNYDWTKMGLELIGGGLSANSQGATTAEQYFANEKGTYKLTDRNYTFEKGAWDKNRFAGIRNRWDSQVGLGRELFKNSLDLLSVEIGGGYVSEERYNAKTNQFTSGRLFAKYIRTLSPTSSFSQDAEYIYDFDDRSDYRVNTETSLLAALAAHLSLKVGYKWQHVGKPPMGFGRNDTTTTIALVATY